MTAEEAKKLTAESKVVDLSSLLEDIEKECRGGYDSLCWYGELTYRQVDTLEKLGYTVKNKWEREQYYLISWEEQ